jgi:hypothetical protein
MRCSIERCILCWFDWFLRIGDLLSDLMKKPGACNAYGFTDTQALNIKEKVKLVIVRQEEVFEFLRVQPRQRRRVASE